MVTCGGKEIVMELNKKVSMPAVVESCRTCTECNTSWCNAPDASEASDKVDGQTFTPK